MKDEVGAAVGAEARSRFGLEIKIGIEIGFEVGF